MSSGLRPVAALLALLTVVTALLLGTAGPASAHATLVGTDPAEGAVLDAAPDRIRLTFNETVSAIPDGVGVYDAAGEPVASTSTVSGDELAVRLADEVGDGTLVVVWRVLSEDGHPAGGSLSFSIGAPSPTVVPPSGAAAGPDDVTGALSSVRVVGYLGLLLAAGLVAFTVLVLAATPVPDAVRRRLVTTARLGAGAAALAWLAALPLTASYQLGGSLADGATWSALAPAEYVVVGVVALGAPLAVLLLGAGPPDRRRALAALAVATLAAAAPALTGHTRAATPEALAVAADVVHLLAGSVWLGGLVGLVVVLPALVGRGEEGGVVLARFSAAGAAVLLALAVTGGLLAWRILGSWSGLVETTYGRLLLAKVATVAVVVALAAVNRFTLLPRLRAAVRRRDRRAAADPVVRATVAEVGLIVVVLLLTGVLVDRSPEDPAGDTPPAYSTGTGVHTATLGGIDVTATIAPHTTGPNTLTVELRDAEGQPTEGLEAPRVRLSGPDVDLGTIPLEATLPGTYTAQVVLPVAGDWQLQVSLRTSEFDNPVADLTFPVFDPEVVPVG